MTRSEAIKHLVEHPDAVLRGSNGEKVLWRNGPVFTNGRYSNMDSAPYTVVRKPRRWERPDNGGAWVECTEQESRRAHGGVAFWQTFKRLDGRFPPIACWPGIQIGPGDSYTWVKWEPA